MRCPRAELEETVMVAVSDVPVPSTLMFDAVIVESSAPAVVRKDSPVAPSKFEPVIVRVKLVFLAPDVGETESISGPLVTETAALCGAPDTEGSKRTETELEIGAVLSAANRLTETRAAGATLSVVNRLTETDVTGATESACNRRTDMAVATLTLSSA